MVETLGILQQAFSAGTFGLLLQEKNAFLSHFGSDILSGTEA